MKKKKIDPISIVTVLIFSIIIILLLTIICRMFTKNIIVEKLKISNAVTEFILQGMDTSDAVDEATGELYAKIDWQAMYPFTENLNEKNQKNVSAAITESESMSRYEINIKKIKGIIEKYCNTYLAERPFFVEKAYGYEQKMGWNMTKWGDTEEVIRYDDGYLVNVQRSGDTANVVNQMEDFKQFLEERGIGLLYVQAPPKTSRTGELLPPGTEDKTNENMDNLLEQLQDRQVACLDLRDMIYRNYNVYEEAFYKTDHHWKTTTAFEAAEEIEKVLHEQFGFEDVSAMFQKENYEKEVYENYFLGSLGKKVTLAVAEPENYELLIPKWKTEFTISIPEREVKVTGDFGEALLDYRHLEKIDYYEENCYASFMNRNDAYANIVNENPQYNRDKKVLILKDSYSTPLIPYLALGTGEIDSVYQLLFNGSIRSLIEEKKPDVVILCYSASGILSSADTPGSFFYLQ